MINTPKIDTWIQVLVLKLTTTATAANSTIPASTAIRTLSLQQAQC